MKKKSDDLQRWLIKKAVDKKLSTTSYQLFYYASDKRYQYLILLTKEMVAGAGLEPTTFGL